VTGGGNGDGGGGSMLCGALFPTALPPPAAGATNTTSAINISSTASGSIRGGSWMLSQCESAAGSPFCTGSALGPMLTPPGIIPLAPTDNATGATGQVLYVFLGSGAAAVAANFSTAASRCRQLGGTLAVFDGNGALEGLASWHSAFLGSVWLGLRLPSATWADGTDLSYSNWAGGVTPAGINGTCAMLALTAMSNGRSSSGVGGALQRGDWGAVSCHSLLPVVCEGGAPAVSEPEDEDGSGLHPFLDPSTQPSRNVSHGSSSYFLYDGVRLTWDDAAVFCGARHTGGQLPSIASAEEAGAMLSLLFGSPYWVGLSDTAEEGSFVWADGNSSRPLPWSGSSGTTLQGQSTDNDCIATDLTTSNVVLGNLTFVVRSCDVELPYVCSVPDKEDMTAEAGLERHPVMLRRQGSLTYGMFEYLFYRTSLYDNDEAERVCQSAGGHLFSPLEPSEMSWVAAAAVRLLQPSVDSAGSSTNASNPTATNAVPAGSPGVIQLGMVIRPNSNLLQNPSPTTSETSSSLTTAIVTSRDGLGTWLPEGVIGAVANATVLTNSGTEAICPQLLTATGDWRLNGSCTDKLPFVCKRLAGLPTRRPAAIRAAAMVAVSVGTPGAAGNGSNAALGQLRQPPHPLAARGGFAAALLAYDRVTTSGGNSSSGSGSGSGGGSNGFSDAATLCADVGGAPAQLRTITDWAVLKQLMAATTLPPHLRPNATTSNVSYRFFLGASRALPAVEAGFRNLDGSRVVTPSSVGAWQPGQPDNITAVGAPISGSRSCLVLEVGFGANATSSSLGLQDEDCGTSLGVICQVTDPDVQLLPGSISPLVAGSSQGNDSRVVQDDTHVFLTHGSLYAVNARGTDVLQQLTLLYGRPGGLQAKVRHGDPGGQYPQQQPQSPWRIEDEGDAVVALRGCLGTTGEGGGGGGGDVLRGLQFVTRRGRMSPWFGGGCPSDPNTTTSNTTTSSSSSSSPSSSSNSSSMFVLTAPAPGAYLAALQSSGSPYIYQLSAVWAVGGDSDSAATSPPQAGWSAAGIRYWPYPGLKMRWYE
ncbi:hypothetical protein Vafri_5997, partial [Volvox africanus]